MSAESEDTPERQRRSVPQYKSGDLLITTGEPIEHIIGQTENAGVFLVKAGRLRWEYYAASVPPPVVMYARNRFESLYFLVLNSITSKQRDTLKHELAGALFAGLHCAERGDVDVCFVNIGEHILFKARANQATRYLLGASAATVIVALLCGVSLLMASDGHDPFALGCMAGGFGAVLSVLHRLRSLEFSKFAPLSYALLEGGVRATLGVSFGLLFVIINQADLVLSTLKGNVYAVVTFAVIAGFNERFMPEIIESISKWAQTSARGQEAA